MLERVATDASAAGWFLVKSRHPTSRPDHRILLEMVGGLGRGVAWLDGPARALTS